MRSEGAKMGAAFALISLIWGSTWLVIKIGLGSLTPIYSVTLRFTLAALILLLIARLRKERIPLDPSSLRLYALLGLLTYSVPFVLVYWGEQRIASGLASVLFAVTPFIVAVGSHFFLESEPLSVPKVVGISTAFAGVLVIFWSDLHLGASAIGGMAAVLVSTAMQGTSLLVVKRRAQHLTPLAVTLGGMAGGVVLLWCMALCFEDFHLQVFDARGVGSILYLSTLGSVVTFLTYYWLAKRVEAVYLALVSVVTPAIAVFLGTLILGESLEPGITAGSVCVGAGIMIANGRELAGMFQPREELP